MGRWLAEFQENTLETGNQTTVSTDTSNDLSVLSVPKRGIRTEKSEIDDRWDPEFASEGYVWCLDCQHFNGVNCDHTDNPFHTVTKCPQAPRKCQWFNKHEVMK